MWTKVGFILTSNALITFKKFSLALFTPVSSFLLFTASSQAVEAAINSSVEQDAVALTMIQSVFRGHLARCSLARERCVDMPYKNTSAYTSQYMLLFCV